MSIVDTIIFHECCRNNISGVVRTASGAYHVCTKHGQVILTPFYVKVKTEITKESKLKLYWACPMCIEDKCGTILEVDQDFCEECFTKNNLIDCHLCGATVCMRHSLAEICLDCADTADRGPYN